MGAGKQRRSRGPGPSVRAEVDSGAVELVPDPDRPRGWTLFLDAAPQSHVDLDDPMWLEFEYVRRIGHVADLCAPAGRPLPALHLGGGALTLPRYIAATRPRSPQQAVETDAGLTAFVRGHLPLDKSARVKVRHGDARAMTAKARDAAFGLVVVDAYGGSRVPAHLTTVEFVREVARTLDPAGVYTANLADGGRLDFVRGQIATIAAVFPHVAMIGDPAVLRGRRFGNVVVAASRRELPVADLSRRTAADPFPGRVRSGRDLDDFTGGAAVVRDATATRSPLPPEKVFSRR
ncbi:fused MFS/spermidine synthase [Yinghuangia sp. ASG 101]|uniref:spermidine synthase n=1 Tax=Yinghuangia sp. ASG 101 TaxID=2896848 RepID=UPI001E4AC89F|nr:fused MFS/spermidine synthase [Yinghuangia sp. ASG 101]UGQ08984.1 fused MFS/spermidine synthase [Yinghuangia sp. ASG 101]